MISFFKIPSFLQPRHSFRRLKSLHLTPVAAAHLKRLSAASSLQNEKQTKAVVHTKAKRPQRKSVLMRIMPTNPMHNSLSSTSLIALCVLASILFISCVCVSFIGEGMEQPYFSRVLGEVAADSPGLVLLGENVDVDVDEPSLTVRWSILMCGQNNYLPGSSGVHGSPFCGLPNFPLNIFVDNDDEPTATYEPDDIPVNKHTGERRKIQNLVQFDSDHVLDVHEARLYPFDTYILSSTFRAADINNNSIPIRKIFTIDITSSFDIQTNDVASFIDEVVDIPSRDFDMIVNRPSSARAIVLTMFGIAWILTHLTIGHVILAARLEGVKPMIKHLLSAGAIVIAIPQLRQSMPDAPGLDGVLVDAVGYFPQMVISSLSVISLLLMLAMREIDNIKGITSSTHPADPESPARLALPPPPPPSPLPPSSPPSYPSSRSNSPSRSCDSFPRPPSSPKKDASSQEIAKYEMYRVRKHLQGEYVFPPVDTSKLEIDKDKKAKRNSTTTHRKWKTLTKITESDISEVSRWSEDSGSE